MIYHIYWGTRGNSGLYLDEIYQSLKGAGFEQKIFVSYYYPFDYGEKIFFRHSDMAYCKVKGIRRKIIQIYEIVKAFLKILVACAKDKPQIINYSLITGSYGFIVLFLKLLKYISGCKLIITCHDICPFGNRHRISSEMKNRKQIFELADKLLVHNENSIVDLQTVFNIDRQKIVIHPFPIMDLTKLQSLQPVSKQCDFLFIGNLRYEKGIDFLIKTWHQYHKINNQATLWICGNPYEQDLDANELKEENIMCHLGYINEEDYCRYIQSARYVVLPYLKGTNSGIISTVLSLGANVITSDIPMFKENPFVDSNSMFKSEDSSSLIELMERSLKRDLVDTRKLLSQYRRKFTKEVVNVYNRI